MPDGRGQELGRSQFEPHLHRGARRRPAKEASVSLHQLVNWEFGKESVEDEIFSVRIAEECRRTEQSIALSVEFNRSIPLLRDDIRRQPGIRLEPLPIEIEGSQSLTI